ncbi:unnamed protein product (mitochondrion) [Plasmodiophora brassicae]|uniref:ELMO domain-containing protein n=1 Tax=Plasmodiophora brassicae TaxID=37360 RepID=A0A3P3YK23_PLABS|nr:unnamed protein product [Plasmodiophora brassicae]
MMRSMAAVVVDWADRVALDLLRRLLPAWLLGPVIGIVKRCLRWASGAGGEIERIAVRPAPAHRRMADLEAAMHRSRVVRPILLAMRAGDDVQAVAKRICAAKHIRAAALVSSAIAECLQAMQAMARLEQDLQSARRTPYDPADASHEALLNKLWKLLRPGVILQGRITSQWGEIGFQGDDPATDFRGNGLLGLANLVAFAESYPRLAQHLCDLYGRDATKFPSFCICGINLTSDALDLVVNRQCNQYLYARGGPSTATFADLYAALWYVFHQTWLDERPDSVMRFKAVHDVFLDRARRRLRSHAMPTPLQLHSYNP